MKHATGALLAFVVGYVARKMDLPALSPPTLYGAILVVLTTLGYMVASR